MSIDVVQGFPQLPGPMVDEDGKVLPAWRYFFYSLWNRTGQAQGIIDLQASLNGISSIPGAILMRNLTGWIGLIGGSNKRVLKYGATLPGWGLLGADNFDVEAANIVLAGPVSGGATTPTFRALVEVDIPTITDSAKIPFKPNTIGTGISAAGSDQAGATALTKLWNQITTVAASTGVRLDNAVIGEELIIFNRGVSTLNVYPKVGSQINALGANNAITLATNGTLRVQPVTTTLLYAQ